MASRLQPGLIGELAAGGAAVVTRGAFGALRLTGALLRPPAAAARTLAIRAVDRATLELVRGETPGVLVDELVKAELVDRVVDRLIEAEVVERVVERLLEAQVAERVVEQLLASPETEQLVTGTLESPELERLIVASLDSPAVRRALEQVANSPEVRGAVAAQSAGLADEVAEQVRVRAAAGDDAAERLARRLLRRRPAEPSPGGTQP